MATLNTITHIIAFDDAGGGNNPQRKVVDWRRPQLGIAVTNPRSQQLQLDPQQEVVVFSGTRTLTIDGTTQFDLSLSSLDSTRYAMTWDGTGTAPGFRTARSVAVATGNVVLTLQANQTVTVTSSLGAVFGVVVAGDVVFVPGVSTGETGPFNSLNEGYWSVLAANATTLTLQRLSGTVFSGASETVAIADNLEFQVFSAAGVQAGDTLDIVSGFATSAIRSYNVVAVTARRLEFTSTLPLALESNVVPTAAGVKVYNDSKRYVYVEGDQELAVKVNADTTENNRVEPWVPAHTELVGYYEKVGTTYALAVKNRSTARANVTVVTAE